MIKFVLKTIAILGTLAATVLPASAQQKFVVDKVVANVGNSVILYSEMVEISKQMYNERRERGITSDRDPMNEALEMLMLQKLLYNQALIDSVEINRDWINEMVDEQVGNMVVERGSVAALEAFENKPIFEIKNQYRIRFEEISYARNLRSEIYDKVTVTPGEVDRYFRKLPKDSLPIIPEQYVYAQIIKFPSSTVEAKQRVRERLLEMRERILDGTRFDLLARMYSLDPGSAVRGGELDPAPKESFVTPFSNALEKMRPGQISEVVETEYGFHIIELLDRKGNLYHARHILLQPQFTVQELAEADHFLDSLAGRIRAGEITFEQAALKYSDDKYSKNNGGIVTNHDILELYQAFDATLTTTKFYKEDIAPDVYRYLSTMKPGDISPAFQSMDMRANVLSKIIKLIEVIPAHPANLKDDYLRIEEMALDDKAEKEFRKWLDQKIAAMYVYIDPEYRGGDFDNPNWLK